MIKVDDLLYELDLSVNRVATEDNMNIPLEDKLVFLNRAQIELIKSRIGVNNVFKAGFEETRKRIDDLQVLKVTDKRIPLLQGESLRYKNHTGDLNIIKDYMFYVESYALVKTKNCEDTVDIDLIREGELNIKYFSENHKPSFEWRTTIGTISNNHIYVYHDEAFKPLTLHLTYLRYPKKIDKVGYIHPDGSKSFNQDSELPEYMKQDLVDLATKYISHFSENQLQAQLTQNRIINNE